MQELTIAIYSSIRTFGHVKKVRPARQIAIVEIEVVGFGQRVEVGGVEFEDVHCMEGA